MNDNEITRMSHQIVTDVRAHLGHRGTDEERIGAAGTVKAWLYKLLELEANGHAQPERVKAYPIPNAAGTWGISLGCSRRLPFSDYWTESAARAACDAINTIVRQGQREAWEAAARLVDMQEPPDYEHGASENGWNDAITHCAATLREREEGDRDE